MLCYVMLCHVMLCYVMSCHVMLCYVMLCYVMLCYVMLCYVMLCYVMLCYVMLCYVMLCYVMLCYVMLCYVMLCYVMLCYVMLCYVMLCYVMLCYVMLCYVMLCYIILYYIILYYIILYYIILYCIILCCLPDDRLTNLRYNIQSLWTRVRKSARNLGIIRFNDKGLPILSTETTGSVLAKEASRFLHFHVQDRFASTLLALPDQGKVGRALTTDTFANGSTWQYNGLNIRFRDWRFIHRARLNCLPVNSVKSRWSNSSPKCRRCDSDETLPHVLCHCRPNMPSILRRHNSIVDRIVNAVQRGSITTDQQVRAANSRLRPDIIVEDDKKVLIIDVCCPFDNNAEALRDAEQRKPMPMKTFCANSGCPSVIVFYSENCVVPTQFRDLQTFTGNILG